MTQVLLRGAVPATFEPVIAKALVALGVAAPAAQADYSGGNLSAFPQLAAARAAYVAAAGALPDATVTTAGGGSAGVTMQLPAWLAALLIGCGRAVADTQANTAALQQVATTAGPLSVTGGGASLQTAAGTVLITA